MEAFLMILVAVAIGTAVGVGAAWVMTQRKSTKPSTGVAMLKDQLQNTESALAAAVVAAETLKKQIAQRDLNVQKLEEELKSRQGLSEEAVQQVRKEAEARAAAAQRAGELEVQLMKLTEEHAHLERLFNDQTVAAEANANDQLSVVSDQLTAVQIELESERKFVQELAAESSRIKAECTELQTIAESERSQRGSVEAQIQHEREQFRQMADHIAAHEAERAHFETERAHFEAERAKLDAERAHLQAQLEEERQAAAQGRDQLAMVQEKLEKLASVFKAVGLVLPAEQASAPAAPVAPAANGNGAAPSNVSANVASSNGVSTNGHAPSEAVQVELQIPPATEEETADAPVTVA
jgi:chromosome segregation ATPase